MKVAAVLLNWRTPEMTLRALDSLLGALDEVPDSCVYVVDNDSQDGSEEKLLAGVRRLGERAKRVTVLQSGVNGGFGAGNNVGIRAAFAEVDPEYIFVLNSDAFPEHGAVSALVREMEEHPQTGIAGSYIYGSDGAVHTTTFRFPSVWSELEGSVRLGVLSKLLKDFAVPIAHPGERMTVDWLAGASMLLRSKVLKEVGLFDESFFLYFEETDLCKRVARAGYHAVFVPESRTMHLGSVSTGMNSWKRVPTYWFDSRLHYFKKNHGAGYSALATATRASGTLLWQARRALQGKPDEEPPRFFRDLVSHAAKSAYKAMKPR